MVNGCGSGGSFSPSPVRFRFPQRKWEMCTIIAEVNVLEFARGLGKFSMECAHFQHMATLVCAC